MTRTPAGRVGKWTVVAEVEGCEKCAHVQSRQIRLHRAANPGGAKFDDAVPVDAARRLAELILQACEEANRV